MNLSNALGDAIDKTLEFVASKNFGQFLIKNLDLLLKMVERPAKYCIKGDDKYACYELSFPIFWATFFILQLARVTCSAFLGKFNRGPIEAVDVVKLIQRWRRNLRCLRFAGLRKMRESKNGILTFSPSEKQASKKPKNDDTPEYNLLEDLINRTYSGCDDDSDSTYDGCKTAEASMNGTSINESFLEEDQLSYAKEFHFSLNDNIATDSNSDINSSLLTEDVSFVESIFGDTDQSSIIVVARGGSTSSPNESNKKFEYDGDVSLGADETFSQTEVVGESIASIQFSDPTDVIISQFVRKDEDGTVILRLNGEWGSVKIHQK